MKECKILDVSYPGQSYEFWVSCGAVVVTCFDDGKCQYRVWKDEPLPEETLPWERFYEKYKGNRVVDQAEGERKYRLGLK
jgi:hypothetical protein